MTHTGPVIIGFDGAAESERAMRETAVLLGACPTLVVVVWEAGRAFEAATLPVKALEAPVPLDVRSAVAAETAATEASRVMAEHGAALAREAGLRAEGLAVADEVTVPDTLVRLASELDARLVVVGARRHDRLLKHGAGSTLNGLVGRTPCPVFVGGAAPHAGQA